MFVLNYAADFRVLVLTKRAGVIGVAYAVQ
jgi:hypothetical protein